MKSDPTKIAIDFDPMTETMRGNSYYGDHDFELPFISHIEGNLYMGGCRDDLILPQNIKHLVSLYPWESYRVTHGLDSFTQVKAYDAAVEPLVPILDGLASWVVACLRSGPTLVHCQAGLNRSGLVTALALMKTGRTAKEAIAFLRQKRSTFVLCNPHFERWVRSHWGVPPARSHALRHQHAIAETKEGRLRT
jgi:hypothetical protein